MKNKQKTPKPQKRKSASKFGSLFNLLRGAAGEKENGRILRLAIETAKEKASVPLLETILRMGRSSPLFDIVIPSAQKKLQMAALQSRQALKPGSLETEIRWALDIVGHQKEEIESFLEYKTQYERALMLGNLLLATESMNGIRESCGATLWEIENHIAYLATFEGFDSQKSYITNLSTEHRRTFAAFFASNIGERNESRVSAEGYQRRLIDKIERWKMSKEFSTYIYYCLTGNIGTVDSIPVILAQEASSSPYDLWETIIKTFIYIVSSESRSAVGLLRNILLSTNIPISDKRLDRIKIVLGITSPVITSNPAYEELLAGRHATSLQLASEQLENDPFDISTLLVLFRLVTLDQPYITNENSLLGKFIETFKSLSDYSDGSAIEDAERIKLNYSGFGHAAAINDLAQVTSTSFLGDTSLCAQILSTGTDATAIKILTGNHEFTAGSIHSDLASTYELTSAGFQTASDSLSQIAKAFAQINSSAIKLEYESATAALNHLETSPFSNLKTEACIVRPWLMLYAGMRDDCITSSVLAVVKTPELLRTLPIKNAAADVGYREMSHLDRKIELPILFYLYGQVTGESSKEIALKVSFKQFLKAHNLIYPSAIADPRHQFNIELKIFFLKNVCTQDTMDLCGTFDSIQKLDSERMQICKSLITLDPNSAEQYEDELIELTRRLSIEEAIQQVESSRIYADASGLARVCRGLYRDLFLRYLDYRGAGLVAEGIVLEREVEGALKTRDTKVVQNYLDNYDISADTLLVDLVEGFVNSFMTAPRYGIDSFIGSRIRHGSFEGAFRDPIEVLKLITKIDSRTGEYDSNNHWLPTISDDGERAAIDIALKTFSKNIDAVLDDAVRRLLFVCDQDHPYGIVSFWPDAETKHRILKYWVIELRGSIQPGATIDQIFYYCLERFFFSTLQAGIHKSAICIEQMVYAKLTQEIDKLLAQVRKRNKGIEVAGMIATISVLREDLEKAKNKVVKWFTVMENDGNERSFTLQTAIEIGFKSVQNLHSRFNAALKWDIEESANVILHPQAFQMINDASYLIFGNIFEHSGYYPLAPYRLDVPPCVIKIREATDKHIEVEIVNAISADESLENIAENCIIARKKIDASEYVEVVQQKKKTGLVRLASRIEHDGMKGDQLEFGIVDVNKFRVSFALPDYLLTSGRMA